MSEDLDFVYNQDTKEMSKRQIKLILDKLRMELIGILILKHYRNLYKPK